MIVLFDALKCHNNGALLNLIGLFLSDTNLR